MLVKSYIKTISGNDGTSQKFARYHLHQRWPLNLALFVEPAVPPRPAAEPSQAVHPGGPDIPMAAPPDGQPEKKREIGQLVTDKGVDPKLLVQPKKEAVELKEGWDDETKAYWEKGQEIEGLWWFYGKIEGQGVTVALNDEFVTFHCLHLTHVCIFCCHLLFVNELC